MNIAIQAFGDKLENAFGFDSFEGLPEDWKHAFGSITKKGTFNVNGQTPDIDNTNVKFVKGWFEDTLPNFLRDNADLFSNDNDVVVHLDADLYGPSVFVLGGIGLLSNRFFVLCDEWTGGESEAVFSEDSPIAYNWSQGAITEFIASLTKENVNYMYDKTLHY